MYQLQHSQCRYFYGGQALNMEPTKPIAGKDARPAGWMDKCMNRMDRPFVFYVFFFFVLFSHTIQVWKILSLYPSLDFV